jgi:hypothetical protein
VRKVALVLVGGALLIPGCSGYGESETEGTSTVQAPTTTETPSSTAAEGTTNGETVREDVFARLQTPSENIHCDAWVYGPRSKDAEMRCFIDEISGPELPRPEGAMCDWEGGRLFQIPAKAAGHRASFCDAFGARPGQLVTLEYGKIWTYGPYKCLSSRLGLLCTNATGHGVFLSRERQEPF